MKTGELVIRKYERVDQNLKALIGLHKSLFSGTKLEDKLIYYDPVFETYLSRIVAESGHYFYVIETENDIFGFLHIREIEGTLFLNNIVINNTLLGRGLGKKLWRCSLDKLSSVYSKETKFILDVFESNVSVVAWYERLGFITLSKKHWLELEKDPLSSNNIDKDFNFKKDENGFLSMFKNEIKISTCLNDNIILHDISYLDAIINRDVKILLTVDDQSYKKKYMNSSYDFQILDTSIRMSTTLGNLIEKI